ncbi:hypothetical protein [Spirosoma validum]|uniref:Glycosyltransferase RgtA/B/C/D-like domain-containing protein n=1 Tax=Spirosoma validum TaxID=2771355 RepID=A0A927AYU8_9BACT|nr:hypothetical protein [Spirosoma validum]MBD2752293.1 hypothetical protein [Spirosoma validum]
MTRYKAEMRWLSVGLFLLLAVSIGLGLYFRASWLWMDEVLSYVLISDPSLVHLNDALVSGLDANPPLFFNVYWPIGHYISLNPLFLRLISVVLFSGTIVVFFWYTTRLIGNGFINFVLISVMVYTTYQNFVHSTGIRSYAILLPISCAYFISMHRLINRPSNIRLLTAHTVLGLLLAFCHNYGAFYLAVSGAFFFILLLWSKDRTYWLVLSTFGIIALVWLVIWYPSFVIQSDAGKPHSWIPLPTVSSFFSNFGDLIPAVPIRISWLPPSLGLDVLRVVLVVGLYLYIAIPGIKTGYGAIRQNEAFQFFLLSGFVYLGVIIVALLVSLTYTSVFISRYMWPSQLLIMYQLVYTYYYFAGQQRIAPRLAYFLPLYALLIGSVIFYKVWKMESSFRSSLLTYLPKQQEQYPVFVERADYFLPIWYHKEQPNVSFMLDWKNANRPNNLLSTTTDYKILQSLADKYHVKGLVPSDTFNATHFSHFYVVDEKAIYQIEDYIKRGQVKVIRELPIDIPGHRLLECMFLKSDQVPNASQLLHTN